MAGKPKPMHTIKQLLLLHKQGTPRKRIARTLQISKNTVKSYLLKLDLLQYPGNGPGMSIDQLVELEDHELEARFHAGNPAYKDDRYLDLEGRFPYLLGELKKTGVTKQLLWEEYKVENPLGYSQSQFCYHLQQQQIASRPSMVLSHEPGDKLFIDFAGKKLSYVDRHSGEVVFCEVFVACLPYSDYGFAIAVPSQQIEDFIFALICCLIVLGGSAKVLVPDNMKTAVKKSSRYQPAINAILEDFANHYKTTIIPTRVASPRDKALVENQVKLLYNRVYAPLRNQQFFSLEELNQAIEEKVRKHNQTRMQRKEYCREEAFLAKEKPLLIPLPAEPFQIKHYKELKVAKNNHVYLSDDKHYYSVPHTLIGQKVKLVYTRERVHIYHQRKQVAVHLRSYTPSGYSTVKEHLCSHHQHYLDRSPGYYINRAYRTSKGNFYELVKAIFQQDRHPEQLYKTCDGLFALQRRTNADTFDKACQIALDYKHYSYGFFLNLLKNKATENMPSSVVEKDLPKHDNLRGKQYYQTKLNFNL